MQENSSNTLMQAINQSSFDDVRDELPEFRETTWDDLSHSEKIFYIIKSADREFTFEYFKQYSLPNELWQK